MSEETKPEKVRMQYRLQIPQYELLRLLHEKDVNKKRDRLIKNCNHSSLKDIDEKYLIRYQKMWDISNNEMKKARSVVKQFKICNFCGELIDVSLIGTQNMEETK